MTKKLLVKGLWRIFIFLSYAMLGSWLFHYVEKTPKTYREMSVDMLDELHQTYPALNHSEFTAFVQKAYEAVRMGKKIEWTFLNTSSYVFTILTTIGYGHMTPETKLGQMLTVVYALVGIPLTMLALKTIGEAIANGIQLFVLRIEKAFFKTGQVDRDRLKTFLATCALMILFLILGSLIEIYAEGWSFVKGIYAWFVVMSTIGFGDYIPFQDMDQNSESKDSLWVLIFFMAFFTLAGLCVVSAVLTSLAQAADEMKSTSQAGSRLVKHIKGCKNRVLWSAMYEVNVTVECELGERKDVSASIKQTRRVRSNSIY